MIIWSYDDMVIWSYDDMIIWSYDHMTIWSYGHNIMIIWSYDHMIIWSYDHMIIWSYYHIIIWHKSPPKLVVFSIFFLPLLGEFRQTSRDLSESSYNSNDYRDVRQNSSKSGILMFLCCDVHTAEVIPN